jgi:hypothetical protein
MPSSALLLPELARRKIVVAHPTARPTRRYLILQ